MRKLLFILVMLISMAFPIKAQTFIPVSVGEKVHSTKVGAAYDFGQFKFDVNEIGEYVNGFQAFAERRVAGKSTSLWGTVTYERKNDITMVDPMAYPIDPLPPIAAVGTPMFDVVKRNTNSLRFGARFVPIRVGPFEPFVKADVGFRNSNDVQPRKLERSYYVGSDINLNNFGIRIGYQFTRVTGNIGTEQQYFVGAFFRF